MKRIYNILACILAAVVLLTLPQDMSAKKAKKGKKAKTEAEAPAKKKTAYEKFISKKGTETVEGFLKVYRNGEDVWFEIPDSLVGKKLIQSSILENSASLEMSVGMEVSDNVIYQIAKTDSLILFKTPAEKFLVEDEGIRKALESSLAQQTLHVFPIKYRNADSTASVVKVNALFDMSKKEVVSFAGLDYGNLKIEKGSFKKDFSKTIGVDCFGSTLGVRKQATFELSLYIPGFGYRSTETPTLTTQILSSVTLMPDKDLPMREVNDRVGVRKISRMVYKSTGAIEKKRVASRWDLSDGEGITIYVDTLLGESWMAAVKKGLEAWNPAFEKAGLKNVIKVLPYPSGDESFRVDNPLVSLVTYAGGSGMGVSANILTDSSTGEIMSVRMLVPGDFVTGVRRASVYTISDVDPRYQDYYVSDDAVCEVLTAKVMGLFGRCLGLDRNMAGSAAFSPEQLSDPAFTQANGITGSVTDDVLFNVFAKPGDKERGLVTIIDRVGPYDEFAIEWLYGTDGTKKALDALVESHKGDPVYFYAPSVKGRISDPRLAKEALGNDPLANYEASMSHLKFVAENASKWLKDDSIPQTYSDLFIDWLWLEMNTTAFRLTPYIGGMYAHDITEGKPKFEPVPEDLQKKCLQLMFDTFSDIRWMEQDKALIQMPGANKDLTRFTNMNLFNMSDVYWRLMHVAMSNVEAGSTYTVEEYLNDVEKLMFRDILKGKFSPAGETVVANYLSMFLQLSPLMKQNYKDGITGNNSCDCLTGMENFRISVSGVPVDCVTDLENYSWIYMRRAHKLLLQARSAFRNDFDRKKIDYLISVAEAALGN